MISFNVRARQKKENERNVLIRFFINWQKSINVTVRLKVSVTYVFISIYHICCIADNCSRNIILNYSSKYDETTFFKSRFDATSLSCVCLKSFYCVPIKIITTAMYKIVTLQAPPTHLFSSIVCGWTKFLIENVISLI